MHLFEGMRCLDVELFPGEVYIPEVYNKNDCKLFVKTGSHKYIQLIKKLYLLFSLTYEIGFIFHYKKNLSYGSDIFTVGGGFYTSKESAYQPPVSEPLLIGIKTGIRPSVTVL
jgi:hypothetical protein